MVRKKDFALRFGLVSVSTIMLTACGWNYRPPVDHAVNGVITIDSSQDVAWKKTMQFLAVKSITPERVDTETRTIFASGKIASFEPGRLATETFIDCGSGAGMRDFVYKLSMAISGDNHPSNITVTITGSANMAKRRRLLFIIPLWLRKVPVSCVSNGVLEREIQVYLSSAK